ncbi:MAG: thiamine-phosphate kinase, partial [Actinobacteria bacterium]|nr:thiamine-phosphate kinase [Actinomycetota bacterium]
MASDDLTLADVGEFALIDVLAQVFVASARPSVEVGLGDDAAVLAAPSGRLVVAVDQMVEGRHFRRDWSSAHDVGRKAAARAMSDIAAMGAVPTALLVALAAPGSLPLAWARELAEGLATEASVVGASVVGGDTAESPTLVVSVTAFGDSGDRALVTRSGARPGDGVFLAGRLGRAAAGLTVLSRGHRQPKSVVAAHRTPEPPYAAGVAAAAAGATSMIDLSDGLLADARHIATASGVVIDLDRSLLGGDDDVEAMARNFGLDVW